MTKIRMLWRQMNADSFQPFDPDWMSCGVGGTAHISSSSPGADTLISVIPELDGLAVVILPPATSPHPCFPVPELEGLLPLATTFILETAASSNFLIAFPMLGARVLGFPKIMGEVGLKIGRSWRFCLDGVDLDEAGELADSELEEIAEEEEVGRRKDVSCRVVNVAAARGG